MDEKLYITRVSGVFLKIILLFFLFPFSSFSTHIVGGALTYVYNGDSSYTFTLKLYRDCSGYDNPASVTISVRGYNGEVFTPDKDITMNLTVPTDFVPSNLDTCADPPNPLPCVEERIFTTTVNNLPPNAGGYHLYYQINARNLTLTNIDATNNKVGETFYAYIPGYSVKWFENFSLANGTTSDVGSTAWTRTLGTPAPNYSRVEGNGFEFSGADNASAIWSSQVINISSFATGVRLSVDLSENSDLEINDSIIVSYSLDGGPVTQFSSNGFIVNDFPNVLAKTVALIGNTVQIFVYVHYDGNSSGEIYRIDNVSVSENNFQANSNPVFDLFPPLFLCVGQAFSFDHSAIDIDGDSLVYSFYLPYDGFDGSPPITAVPPTFSNNTASFTPIYWLAGFSTNNPLGSVLNLISSTGLLTGTPNTIGQYVVGVMVKEYRNGICIDSTLRDFQFNVVNCPPPATAELPDTISACSGLSVSFSNLGNPSTNNWWNFGDPGVTNDTSVIAATSYSYPVEGYYNVTLITNKGTFCADTASATVLVCWVDGGFVADTVGCAGDLWDFNDTSIVASNDSIISSFWDFGDGGTSTALDTIYSFLTDGSFTVTHIVTTSQGCTDTIIKTIVVDPGPVFIVDLTGNPDSVWTSPSVVRDCRVCGAETPDVCITFILTIDIATQAISFDIPTGAIPPGSLYYQLFCGDSNKVGDTICFDDAGPHHITFCKPGNNPNTYTISAITFPDVSPPITVSEGCLDTISATGYLESSLTWTSVFPGVQGAYDGYLGCASGCDTVVVTAQPGYPPSVDYMACGLPVGGGSCAQSIICDTTTVYFVSTLAMEILPQNPTICFGGANATITANPTGGAQPYSYLWSTGAITSAISVGVGTYFVTVSDTTDCQDVTDSVTVTAFASTINSDAGIDQVICAGSPAVTLNGIVTGVSTGTWSGGNGTFLPNNDSLNTSYNPTVAEISGGSVQLFLTTTNNGTCPLDKDTVLISFNPVPTIALAGPDQVICGVTSATLSANSPSVGTGVWSLVSGTATITSPNNPTTTITGLVAGTTNILRWTISNGVCPPSTDEVTISVDLLPTSANAGTDQVLCNTSTTILGGNSPSVGNGSWSVISGIATIANPASPSSSLTGLVIGGAVSLQWTITQGQCSSTDVVTITVDQSPTIANAGPDQGLCNITSATLAGNLATTGSGVWSVVSGTGTITTPTSPTSTVTGLVAGINFTIQWTISNGVCPATTDDVVISVFALPTTANAGSDQTICTSTATITANAPTVGTGVWSLVSGSATISNPNSASTTVTGLTSGSTYTFRWTISNGTCPPSTDNIIINVDLPPTIALAGNDQTICATAANISANTPTVGTGVWSVISGSATIANPNSASTSVSGLASGSSYIIRWTISNGTCPPSSDDLIINVDLPPTTANAGSDQTICTSTATITANAPTVGTGVWSLISGSATISNPNSASTTVTGLTSGSTNTFRWTISNGTCPPSTDNIIINVDLPPTIALAGNDQTICATAANISANTPTVGTGVWSVISGSATIANPNSASTSVSGLVSGSSYIIRWTISNGTCPLSSDDLIINVDLPPTTANTGSDQTICTSTATITANAPTVGTGVWSLVSGSATISNPNSASTTVTGLTSGSSYTFRWTISNGTCPPSTDDITVSVDIQPTISNAGIDQIICGATTTSLDANIPTTGTGTWSISSGSATIANPNSSFSQVSSLIPGSSNVFIWTIANGVCPPSSDSVTIYVDLEATASNAGNNQVICNVSISTLSANTPVVGNGLWTLIGGNAIINTPSSPSTSVSGLIPGDTAYFQWTISQGLCFNMDTVYIYTDNFSNVPISGSNVSCFSGNDGTATVTPLNGNPPYSFLWSDSQNGSTAIGLMADTHSVTVTDNNGCSVVSSIIITEPGLLTLSIDSSINVSCKGGNDGSAFSTTNGGTSPYSFLWNTGNGTSDISGLIPGTYFVTASDLNSCTAVDSVTITEPAFALSVNISSTDVLCKGDANGTATVIPSGGTDPFSYLWSIGSQNDSTATGLIAGVYQVTVTDFNNCIFDTLVTVSEPATLLSLDTSSTPVICFGDNNGTATVIPSGGISPYIYLWDTLANSQNNPTATGLIAGIYEVTVTDNNNCVMETFVKVDQPASPLSIIISTDSVICYGGNDGSATVVPSGGISPYTYAWDDTNFQTYPTATGLSADTFNVTVTDNTGNCIVGTSIKISQPDSLILNSVSDNVRCFGGNDGSASVTPAGGISPYSYSWNSGETVSQISNLISQIYSVTVTDNNGCSDSAIFNITEPSLALSFTSLVLSHVSCYGGNNGQAEVVVAGGIFPYSFLWNDSNQSITSNIFELYAGSYNVTISDSNNCFIDTTVIITEPFPGLTVSISATDVSCYGGNDGTATIIPAGGTSPYNYQWDSNAGSQNDSTATGLSSGTFSVTVTDNNGCVLIDSNTVSVGQPASYISVITSQKNLPCFGDSSASATLTVSGGTPPYSYLWGSNTGSQVDSTATGLASGTYMATITDNNGCADGSSTITITEPSPLILTLSSTNVICKGDSNGSATITPSGGTAPYSINWDPSANSQTGNTATGLKAGTYTAIVSDTNGCKNDSALFTIMEPADSLFLAISFTGIQCFGESNGTATVTPSGGWPPYNFQWSNNAGSQTDSTATGLKAGTYSVVVSDYKGCIDTAASITVSQPQVLVASAQNDTICPGSNAIINVAGNGGTGDYIFVWNEIDTAQSITVNPIANTLYTVVAYDENNCASKADSATVFVRNYFPDSLKFSCGNTTCVLCPGGSTQIWATYYEEFPPYNYLWDHSLGTGLGPKTVSPQSTTDYIIKVTDQCGSFQDTMTVIVESFPVIDVVAVPPGCEPHTAGFTNSVQNPAGSIYRWNFGDGTTMNDTVSAPIHEYSTDGTFNVSLIISTPSECYDTAITAATVLVYPQPEPNCTANPGTATLRNPVINFQTGDFNSWSWNFGDGNVDTSRNPVHTYLDSGDYYVSVLVTNQYNCENTCEVHVRINPEYPLGIPNAFTPDPNGPNGGMYSFEDFTNNVFFPITRYVTEFRMEIFNRWGELIFISEDIDIGWDGYYKGELCQQDVYAWKIHLQWWDGNKFDDVGDVTLLR